jgi:hypothetical protein
MPNRNNRVRRNRMPLVNNTRQRRRNRRTNGKISGNMQSIHVNYKELWTSVGQSDGFTPTSPPALFFVPGASGLPQLDALGSLYESYRLTGPVHVEFKSSAGSVNNGTIIAGVDYDARDIVTGFSGCAALQPRFVGSITKDHRLTVTPDRAMNKKWLFSAGQVSGEAAFAVVYSTSSALAGGPGDIWCEYTVEFISPRIPSANVSESITLVREDGSTYNTITNVSGNLVPVLTPENRSGTTTQVNSRYNLPAGTQLNPGSYRISYSNANGTGALQVVPGPNLSNNSTLRVLSQTLGDYQAILDVYNPIVAGSFLFDFNRPKAALQAVALACLFFKSAQKLP